MPTRIAEAEWKGSSRDGQGTMKVESGTFDAPYSYTSRFEDGKGTNPEELIAAAHAGCFSMALSSALTKAGFKPNRIHTTAKVSIEKVGDDFSIQRSELITEADVPGIDQETLLKHATAAKVTCPVSRALAGVQITLDAKLLTRV
jgi:osmotically inducible protein OsmC